MAIPDHEIDPESLEEDKENKKKIKKEKKEKKKKKDKKKKSKSKKDEGTSSEDAAKIVEETKGEATPIVEEATDKSSPDTIDEIITDGNDEVMDDNDDDDNGTDYFDKSAGDERKIFLSRIPAAFNEEAIAEALNKVFGEDSVDYVALTEPKKDEEEGENYENLERENDPTKEKEHCGFAFVTMSSVEKRNEAIEKGTVRGKVKETSKRKHTLYIRPIVRQDEGMGDETSNEDFDSCFLWKKFRCPYGDDCKFKHVGEGGCEEKKEPVQDKRSNQKCFSFRTKGKCKLGDDCPYSHDFEPKKAKSAPEDVPKKDSKEKDCINWKTKGKCRKGEKCPYRHDDAVRQAFLAKKQKKVDKKRGRDEKVSQPLSVRVFGLNYDTTEDDVREYFKDVGVIKEIMFPTYEDSGRSKGYCGVLFVSPKATEKACELDGKELHGRWLSVQPGKMYLKQWEQREQDRKDGKVGGEDEVEEEQLGEFGQKVKKRKKFGFKDE